MKFQFIHFILAVFIGLLFPACQSNESSSAGHMETKAETTVPVSLKLTAEQMELAGIELGKPEKRVISNSIGCTGKVEVPPESLASVYSSVNGFVNTVKHLNGDYVRKGSLLTTISHPDLVKSQRQFLESHSRLAFLEKEYERKKALAAVDATSKKAFEQAEAELQMERATHKGLKAELQFIGINTDKLEAGGELQKSVVLTAPINGYIVSINVNKGKLVSPNDLLYEIVDDSHVHLELEVFAKDLHRLKKGQHIEAHLPGNDHTYHANIHLIGRMIDPATKTTMVHGHFKKEPVQLTPGTYMQARIFMGDEEVWTLPESAVIRQGDEAFIFVKKDEGFEKVKIETGNAMDGFITVMNIEEIENQTIALKGAYYLNGTEG